MKQYITKEQWRDLVEADGNGYKMADNFLKAMSSCNIAHESPEIFDYKKVTIGKMIELLGDNWELKLYECGTHGTLYKKYKGELCDALWEAVEYKLKKL